MALEPLGALLHSSRSKAQQPDVKRQVDATRVCALWSEVVRSRCSEVLSCRSNALSFQQGVLCIGVASSVVATELRAVQHHILEEVHVRLGQPVVVRVVFRTIADVQGDSETALS